MLDLAPRQQDILRYIHEFIARNACPPSVREIAAAFGFRSTNGAASHINALERKGYLEKLGPGGLARSLRLTERALSHFQVTSGLDLPLLGSVVAGGLNAPASYEGERVHVDQSLLPVGAPAFALRVTGDSMIGDNILDGDIVIVRQQTQAREHEIVVAVLDGETTVKRYHQGPKGITLVPANPRLKPIPVSPERDFSIAGVVVGLCRKLV